MCQQKIHAPIQEGQCWIIDAKVGMNLLLYLVTAQTVGGERIVRAFEREGARAR